MGSRAQQRQTSKGQRDQFFTIKGTAARNVGPVPQAQAAQVACLHFITG